MEKAILAKLEDEYRIYVKDTLPKLCYKNTDVVSID